MAQQPATPAARSVRLLKVGEQVRHVISELLMRQEVHDDVLSSHTVSVTEVRMSPDLRLASVYVKPLLGADAFFLDVTGRTAKRLLDLAGDQDVFSIPITQEELAGLVGASRERVNKAISAFLRLGWIEQNDREYRILKRREMEIRAN